MAHALAANAGRDDFDTALFTDDPAVLHALVFTAVALEVLHGPEDLRTEEAVALRLEGPVVDRLRLLDLAVTPLLDLIRGGDRDADALVNEGVFRFFEKAEDIRHMFFTPIRSCPPGDRRLIPTPVIPWSEP